MCLSFMSIPKCRHSIHRNETLSKLAKNLLFFFFLIFFKIFLIFCFKLIVFVHFQIIVMCWYKKKITKNKKTYYSIYFQIKSILKNYFLLPQNRLFQYSNNEEQSAQQWSNPQVWYFIWQSDDKTLALLPYLTICVTQWWFQIQTLSWHGEDV